MNEPTDTFRKPGDNKGESFTQSESSRMCWKQIQLHQVKLSYDWQSCFEVKEKMQNLGLQMARDLFLGQ